MKFSEKLTELRHSRGWSQEQLGERLGVTRQGAYHEGTPGDAWVHRGYVLRNG